MVEYQLETSGPSSNPQAHEWLLCLPGSTSHHHTLVLQRASGLPKISQTVAATIFDTLPFCLQKPEQPMISGSLFSLSSLSAVIALLEDKRLLDVHLRHNCNIFPAWTRVVHACLDTSFHILHPPFFMNNSHSMSLTFDTLFTSLLNHSSNSITTSRSLTSADTTRILKFVFVPTNP